MSRSTELLALLRQAQAEPPLRAGTYHDRSMGMAMQQRMDTGRLEYLNRLTTLYLEAKAQEESGE